jgi:ectoine hydroxylase-related dioxygenase (phytanoyl-CoA dioxygenase family)
MNDHDVLDFCRNGYIMLEGVVPDDINDRVMEYCDQYAGASGEIPIAEPWLVSAVTLNPALAGVLRSLLGRDFAYLDRAATHRSNGAQPGQRWHRDGGAVHGPRVDCLMGFYLPQETTLEMGPTEVLPGSHHLFQIPQYMAHYSRIRGSTYACAPAGSIFVTHYAIWHRRSSSTSSQVRNLLKFWYLRTTPPQRDWQRCDDFTLEQAFHLPGGHSFGREGHLVRNQAVEMLYWLSGEHDVYGSVVPSSNLPVYYFWNGARPAAG